MAGFSEGQKLHLYVLGCDLYECTVTKADAESCTVQYSGGQGETMANGTLANIDLRHMYLEDPENSPVPTENPDLVRFGDGSFTECVLAEYDLDFPEKGYNDMTDMRKLNDCELARSLRTRFFNKECYSRCGPTLVAVNLKEPIKDYMEGGPLATVYSEETMLEYKNMKDRNAMDPHAWNLASKCWQAMFLPLQEPAKSNDQAIVITGESGAGKSFQTKKMLDFLAYVGGDPDAPADEDTITDQMLSTTPILEGFGNANMPRNPDSSRFGKLYKVYFDKGNQKITGCEIENYMLEKSRVTSQQIGERNYHMFYRMLYGGWGEEPRSKKGVVQEAERLPADGREKYMIRDVMHFKYLKGGVRPIPEYEVLQNCRPSPTTQVVGGAEKETEDFEDKEKMGETYKAMKFFFSDEAIDAVFCNTMGALWMGNIEITGDNDASEVVDSGSSAEAIDAVATLWKVDREALKAACNTKSLLVMKKYVPTNMSCDGALGLRDAIAKSVYEKQFDYVVNTCSNKLAPPSPMSNWWMGVLDIFGFEFVPTIGSKPPMTPFVNKQGKPNAAPNVNSFEQFCINLCNEQLQGHFVDCIFKLEQELYKQQLGHEIKINFTTNDDTIDLIINRKTGIINYLDEVAKNPPKQDDPDKKFWDKLKKSYGTKNKRLSWPPTKGRSEYYGNGFELQHYAATVLYDVKNWVSKDADEITHDTWVALGNSGDAQFLAPTFGGEMEHSASGPACIGGAFKNKLGKLLDTLRSADSSFVRCIKCSNPLVRGYFNPKEVLNQLKYTGMLDTLKIRRAGFAMRLSYQQFFDEYHVLDVHAADEHALVESVQAMVPQIVAGLADPPNADQQNPDGTWDAIRIGMKGLVLARDWVDRELQTKRKEILSTSAVVIQAAYRSSANSKDYTRQRAAWGIQAALRSVQKTVPYEQLRGTVLKIMPEMHAFTGRVIAARAADTANFTAARNEMNAFLEDNKRLERMEADERKLAAAEDEYSWKLMDATFSTRVAEDKRQYLTMAETAYKNAMETNLAVKDFIESTDRKGAESDARWQKMQTEGVVRAVPLVRQYKSEAAAFSAPSKDAYRFKYSFSYKGAKAVELKAAPVVEEAPPPAPAGKGPPGKGPPGKGPPKEETFFEKVEGAAEELISEA